MASTSSSSDSHYLLSSLIKEYLSGVVNELNSIYTNIINNSINNNTNLDNFSVIYPGTKWSTN